MGNKPQLSDILESLLKRMDGNSTLTVSIETGAAPMTLIKELLDNISDLNRALGGAGLTWTLEKIDDVPVSTYECDKCYQGFKKHGNGWRCEEHTIIK